MRRLIAIGAVSVLAIAASAQSTPASDSKPVGAATIHAGTQLVLVDVVVQDRDGHAVHGLKREDFVVTENKLAQEVRNFDEHTAPPSNARGPELPPLPPGTFTDYTPTPPGGALNILLLDALNTPMKDQSYVRYQLQQYVKKADPNTRIAIFGLTSRLIILQGFSSDPQVLKDAVDHKLIPRASVLLDDPAGTNTDSDLSGLGQVAANVTQFQAEAQSFQTQLRVQYTLNAFSVLARYLSAFPGRKNLIWFSGSFPIAIVPDATLPDPFSVVASFEDQYRETANLLTRAQVAVYPIDARGLMTQPMFDASRSGHGMTGPSMSKQISDFGQSQALEHMTMDELAADTGGHAFYNTNGLADAVAKAIDSGSNYYTIAYDPTKWTGAYRHIHIDLTGAAAARGLKLTYREGYYADDPRHPHPDELATSSLTEDHTSPIYAAAAMGRGAPTPEDILFKVRVLPASTTTEDTLAPGNQPDPQKPIKGPFRRFDIDYAVLPNFTFKVLPDGIHSGSVEFTVLVYDADGKLLNAAGKTINMALPPEPYKQMMKTGVGMHLEVSAPAKAESYFRIAVHDLPSNRFGVVEVPVTSIIHLAPPPAPAAPPATAPPATNP